METLKDLIEDLAKVVVEDFDGKVVWIGIHPNNRPGMSGASYKNQMLRATLPNNCEFIGEARSFSAENYYRLTFKWPAKNINPRIINFGNIKFGFSLTRKIENVFYAKRILGKKLIFLDKTENIPELTQYLSSKVETLVKNYDAPSTITAFWGGKLNEEGLQLEVRQISEIDWMVSYTKEMEKANFTNSKPSLIKKLKNRIEVTAQESKRKKYRLLKGAIDFNLKFYELLQSY